MALRRFAGDVGEINEKRQVRVVLSHKATKMLRLRLVLLHGGLVHER